MEAICIYTNSLKCPYPCPKCEKYSGLIHCYNYPNKCIKCANCKEYNEWKSKGVR